MCFCLSFNHVLLELAYSKHKLPLEFKASKKVVASSRSSAFTFSFRFSSWIFPFGFFSRSSSHPYWMYELILSDKKKKYHIKTSLTISCQNYKSGSFQHMEAQRVARNYAKAAKRSLKQVETLKQDFGIQKNMSSVHLICST